MKQDVLDALSGRFPERIPSKETLNHPGLISHVAGFDVFDDTPRAFDIAWERLGITMHPGLPEGNAPRPRVVGGTWEENGWRYSDVGVYPTSMPVEHARDIPKDSDDWVFEYDTSRDDFDLDTLVEEKCARNRAFREHFGGRAVMYDLYYTTLFMWAVVTFDWEPFMLAAGTDPERFDRELWEPWSRISRKHLRALASTDEEVVFCHDDLAMSTGPVRLSIELSLSPSRYSMTRYGSPQGDTPTSKTSIMLLCLIAAAAWASR